MIGVMLLIVAVAGQAPIHDDLRQRDVPVTVDRLPARVVAVIRYAIGREGQTIEVDRQPVVAGGRVIVRAPAGETAVLSFIRRDGAYLADGPFTWPDVPRVRSPGGAWRRTLSGSASGDVAGVPLEWIGGAPAATAEFWPRCFWRSHDRWECWGVPLRSAGVLVADETSGRLRSSVVHADGSAASLRPSRWGRMLFVRFADAGALEVKPTFARALPPPARRMRALRWETETVASARAEIVSSGVWWLSGDGVPPHSWLEIRAAGHAPSYVALEELAAGSHGIPFSVVLGAEQRIAGMIADASGRAAGAALVTLFRLIDPMPTEHARDKPKPRRVFAEEMVTLEDGRFSFANVGDGQYEVLAWHARLGSRSIYIRTGDPAPIIRLEPRPLARGRVLVDGRPAAGVSIVSVPDPEAFAAADDIVDVKGGDTTTDRDGRFSVAMAKSGGGELRIGGGPRGVKRIPLPRGDGVAPIVDLGDIALGGAISVTVVLDRDPGCDLNAAGPLDRTGLQVVEASRTGPGLFTVTVPEEGRWQFVLMCGREERRVTPAVVDVKASDKERSVTLLVR